MPNTLREAQGGAGQTPSEKLRVVLAKHPPRSSGWCWLNTLREAQGGAG